MRGRLAVRASRARLRLSLMIPKAVAE